MALHSDRVSVVSGRWRRRKTAEMTSDAIAPASTGTGRKDSRLKSARDVRETRERKRTSAKKYASRAERWLEGSAGFTCPVAKKMEVARVSVSRRGGIWNTTTGKRGYGGG